MSAIVIPNLPAITPSRWNGMGVFLGLNALLALWDPIRRVGQYPKAIRAKAFARDLTLSALEMGTFVGTYLGSEAALRTLFKPTSGGGALATNLAGFATGLVAQRVVSGILRHVWPLRMRQPRMVSVPALDVWSPSPASPIAASASWQAPLPYATLYGAPSAASTFQPVTLPDRRDPLPGYATVGPAYPFG